MNEAKVTQCHARNCDEKIEWSPSSPSELFISRQTLRKHGWILFRGDAYCLPCGVQAIADLVDEIENAVL
jgi:hypothetical protein